MRNYETFKRRYLDYFGNSALLTLEEEIAAMNCLPNHFVTAVYHQETVTPRNAIYLGGAAGERKKYVEVLNQHPQLVARASSTSADDFLTLVFQRWAITSGLEMSDSEMLRRILHAS
jgi:hypothetical protein